MKSKAFREFEENLDFAKRLVGGGTLLEGLAVASFDVTDLYRSAWVQAVSALDHWVHEEIYQRAVALVQHPSASKPRRLREFEIPVELFDQVHHRDAPLADAFADRLRQALGWRSFQHPDRIKEGFGLVTDISLWHSIAERISLGEPPDRRLTTQDVRQRLLTITDRRNRIAHSADRDLDTPGQRAPLTAEEVESAIGWLQLLATTILDVLNDEGTTTAGNGYLLVLSDGVAVRWVLEHERFAFTVASQVLCRELQVGDTLYLVTTRGCWGQPHLDATRVIGTAAVSGPVRDLAEPIRIAEREFVSDCPLRISNLAPIGTGVELTELARELETFKDSGSNYGIRLRRTLVRLTPDDSLRVRKQLTGVVGDPDDHKPDYGQWAR